MPTARKPSRKSTLNGSPSSTTSQLPNEQWIEPPFCGFIETTEDALLILEAARRRLIPRVTRRLSDRERKLIASGSVFVFEQEESGIKRWIDLGSWSPSRIQGNFLLYRETNKRNPDGSQPVRPGHPSTQPSSSPSGLDRAHERLIWGSPTKYKEDGLMKKTFFLTLPGTNKTYHIVSYYKVSDVETGRLRTPSSLPEFAALEISPDFLERTHFRVPPRVELGEDGIVRFRGGSPLPLHQTFDSEPPSSSGTAVSSSGNSSYGRSSSYRQPLPADDSELTRAAQAQIHLDPPMNLDLPGLRIDSMFYPPQPLSLPHSSSNYVSPVGYEPQIYGYRSLDPSHARSFYSDRASVATSVSASRANITHSNGKDLSNSTARIMPDLDVAGLGSDSTFFNPSWPNPDSSMLGAEKEEWRSRSSVTDDGSRLQFRSEPQKSSYIPSVPVHTMHLGDHSIICNEPIQNVHSPEDLTERIQLKKRIGSGGNSDVWHGTLQTATGEVQVAIKELRMRTYQGNMSHDERLQKRFFREMLLWIKLRHCNIVPLLGYSLVPDGLPQLISPWYSKGTVIEYIRLNPDVNRLQILHDVAQGLNYLHLLPLVHGDIKGDNILVDEDGVASICDFGLAKFIDDAMHATGFTTTTQGTGGTVRFLCPELLEDEPKTTMSDIWAFGCLIIQVMTSQYPYADLVSAGAVQTAILRGRSPLPTDYDTSEVGGTAFWDAVRKCWEVEPRSRPSIAELLGLTQQGPTGQSR